MSNNKIKILIAGEEVCGYIKSYQNAFQKLGYTCSSAIHNSDPRFPDYEYDFDLRKYSVSLKPSFLGIKISFLEKLFFKIKQSRIKAHFVKKEAIKYDVVIYLWKTLLNNYSDLEILKKNNSKLLFLFVGSEVRYNKFFLKKYNMNGLNLEFLSSHQFTTESIKKRLKYIRTAEKYASLIYSVPDQSGLQSIPYQHLHVPMNIKSFQFKNNERKVPVIIHAPGNPGKKGTDVIENTLEKLKNEGLQFQYKKLENIPNNQVVDFLMNADILVDELIFHGPATLSFEAMLCGCAVATRHLTEHRNIFDPPVIDITPSNIYEKLKTLINDFDLQQKYIKDGRRYVEQHNDVNILAKNMLSNLKNPREADYFPKLELELFNETDKKILSKY